MSGDEPPPVALAITDTLDLHTFAPADVPDVVAEYLAAARDRGLRVVRIIHGRGRGVQKARVQALLAASPLVARASEAPAELGGWGATVVELRGKADASDTPST
jgi:DNA-nicking Smr family endonuclease